MMKKVLVAIYLISIFVILALMLFRTEDVASDNIQVQTSDQLYVLGKEYIGSKYTVFVVDFESMELHEVLALPKMGYWRFIDGETHNCLYLSYQEEYHDHSVEIYSLTGEELSLLLEVNIPHDVFVKGYAQDKVICKDGYYDVESREYHANEDDIYYLSMKTNGDLLTYNEPWIGIEKVDGSMQACVQGTGHSVWDAEGSGFIFLNPNEIPHYHVYHYKADTRGSIQYPELKNEDTEVASYCYEIALSIDGKYFAYYSYNPGKAYLKKDTMDTNLIITDLSMGKSVILDDNEYEYIFEYGLRWVIMSE